MHKGLIMANKTSKRSKFNFLDTHLFDAFLAASETQNFTQAAQMTHMTQAGVSQHIAKLENQLNQPLFKRIGKRVELTPMGRRLVDYINEQKRLQYNFLKEIGLYRQEEDNVIKLGIPERLMFLNEVIDFLNEINQQDEFVLEIALASSEEIYSKIVSGELNFGLVSGFKVPEGIEYQEFCSEEFVLTVGNKDSEFYDKQFVKYPDSDEVYSYWQEKYASSNKRRLSYIQSARIRRVADAVDLVSEGLGSGVFPYHMISQYIESEKLYVPLNNVSITGKVCFAYSNKPGKQPSELLQSILDNSIEHQLEKPQL